MFLILLKILGLIHFILILKIFDYKSHFPLPSYFCLLFNILGVPAIYYTLYLFALINNLKFIFTENKYFK